jgi:hypothetical protein
MRTDIDYLINLMKDYTFNDKTISKDEMGEQEEGGGGASGGGPGYPAVTKWNSGVTRGPANQVGNTKWKDSVSPARGKANTLL